MSESNRMFDYEKDGTEIYRRSFATIRAEAELAGLPADVAQVAVRMIHACGMTDLVQDIAYSPRSSRTPARPCAPERRSSATRRWSPAASPASGCPPTTR